MRPEPLESSPKGNKLGMGDVSLELIQQLRAKADASTFAAEAEAFRAKADELSGRHQERPEPLVGDGPAADVVEPAEAEGGLSQWRTPAWWLVQSSTFESRDSKPDPAAR